MIQNISTVQHTSEFTYNSYHPDYRDMQDNWKLAEDIKAGTPAIKDARGAYLPQEPKETYENYAQRLNRAIFHNISSKTISSLTGLALRRSITLGSDAPKELHAMWDDIDLCGSNLDQFAQDVLEESMWKGHTFIWVDFSDGEEVGTLADLRKSSNRPYFVHIQPENVINWRYVTSRGRRILTMVNTREYVEVDSGMWGSTVSWWYRTYRLNYGDDGPYVTWELRDHDGVIRDSGILSGTDEIPLYPVYSRQTGFFKSVPMLLDMYFLNIRHYQVASDRSYHLHLCAVPFLKLKGRDNTTDVLVIAPNTAIDIPADGDVAWVELDGKTLRSQLEELQSLEMRMYTLGVSTFGKKAVERRTATEASQDFFTANSDLHRLLRNFKNALERAFDTSASMLRLSTRGSLNVSVDYDFLGTNPQEIQAMYDAYDRSILPMEEVRRYLDRKQLTSDEFDPNVAAGTYKQVENTPQDGVGSDQE